MLKGRGKVVKPTFKPKPRGPPSTQSSARPSVERLSQTPVPALHAHPDLPASSEPIADDANISKTVSGPADLSAQVANNEAATNVNALLSAGHTAPHNAVSPKRKEREEEVVQPPAKRLQSDRARSDSPAAQIIPTSTSSTPVPQPTAFSVAARSEQGGNASSHQPEQAPILPTSNTTPTTDVITRLAAEVAYSKAQPHAAGAPVNDGGLSHGHPSRSPSPPREASPENPRYRYPSPENMVRIASDVERPASDSVSMGPAGGAPTGPRRAGEIEVAGDMRQIAQISEIVPMASLNPDGTSGGIIEEATSGTGKGKKKGKATSKRRRIQAPEEELDARATVEMQLNRPRRAAGARKPRKKKEGEKKQRQRAETPEGAEDEEIDPSALTMSELCKDLKIGKKFSKHGQIKANLQAATLKKIADSMQANDPDLVLDTPAAQPDANAENAEAGQPGGAEPGAAEGEEEEVVVSSTGMRMQIVDGVVVMNERSLHVNRQAEARATAVARTEVEEDDFTKIVTSGTNLKRPKNSRPWDAAGTELFYYALARFGTNFEMITELFPHRDRRTIKLKFNKEERTNPDRVNAVLLAPRKPIDLKEFERLRNKPEEPLEDVADIEASLAAFESEKQAEIDAFEAEQAEIVRKKKEAIRSKGKSARAILDTMASDEEVELDPRQIDSAKENRGPSSREASAAPGRGKGKRAPRKKKPAPKGGEIVSVESVLPSIEHD